MKYFQIKFDDEVTLFSHRNEYNFSAIVVKDEKTFSVVSKGSIDKKS